VTRFQRVALVIVAVALVASCFEAPYPQEMDLQHSPTVIALIALPITARRWPLSDRAIGCLAAFLLLHTLGARYIYSNVPYDRWAETWLGQSLSGVFDWRRNHYDRLVHLAFGALWVVPVREVFIRHLRVGPRLATYLALEFVLASSALYELFEWALTMVLSPADANEYNGQQGDFWDAQKDIALATFGALLGSFVRVGPGHQPPVR
jgi:putative membrane protein